VAQGAVVYEAKCIACHGPTGTEGPNDPLVGGSWPDDAFPEGRRTIGSYWPHASTVFDYITRAMPQDRPGSLTADETYGVVAWILHQNGIIPGDAVLDAASLPVVVMPAGDRFVPDDRRGGAEVR
jgi:cytochrome c